MLLKPIQPHDMEGRGHWIGASSFETRSVAGPRRLPTELRLEAATVVNYTTPLRQTSREALAKNRGRLLASLRAMGVEPRERDVFAFRMGSLRHALDEVARSADLRSPSWIVVDISCLTKIHAVALAEWLSEMLPLASESRIAIQYSNPASYGWGESSRRADQHFSEMLYAPLGRRVRRSDDGEELEALVILGHEGARLQYALASFHFVGGLRVTTRTAGPSDFEFRAKMFNRQFLSDSRSGILGVWDKLTVEQADTRLLAEEVTSYLARPGRSTQSRTVIFPLGPKSTTIQAVLTAIAIPEVDLWVGYPVPATYSSDYSAGVGETTIWECVLE